MSGDLFVAIWATDQAAITAAAKGFCCSLTKQQRRELNQVIPSHVEMVRAGRFHPR